MLEFIYLYNEGRIIRVVIFIFTGVDKITAAEQLVTDKVNY